MAQSLFASAAQRDETLAVMVRAASPGEKDRSASNSTATPAGAALRCRQSSAEERSQLASGRSDSTFYANPVPRRMPHADVPILSRPRAMVGVVLRAGGGFSVIVNNAGGNCNKKIAQT